MVDVWTPFPAASFHVAWRSPTFVSSSLAFRWRSALDRFRCWNLWCRSKESTLDWLASGWHQNLRCQRKVTMESWLYCVVLKELKRKKRTRRQIITYFCTVVFTCNWPFPSSPHSLFECGCECGVFGTNIIFFIHIEIRSSYHNKSFALWKRERGELRNSLSLICYLNQSQKTNTSKRANHRENQKHKNTRTVSC